MTINPATLNTAAWQTQRRAWAKLVHSGGVICWRCGVTIRAGEPWDLGHHTPHSRGGDQSDASPEHRHRTGACPGNRAEGRAIARRRRPTSREW